MLLATILKVAADYTTIRVGAETGLIHTSLAPENARPGDVFDLDAGKGLRPPFCPDGGYWRHDGEWHDRRLARLYTDAERDDDGIWRWKINGLIPPEEYLESLGDDERERHEDARTRDYAKLREARRRQPMGAEELAEMRAAFGPDTEVVDVVTGKRYRT